MSDDEIARLVAALDDSPDPLHGDRTPAVHALVEHGLDALPPLFPILEGEGEPLTRLRAQRVLEGVSRAELEAERGPGRASRQPAVRGGPAAAWDALWRENGAYDWQAGRPERAAAVARWRAWVERRRA